jgi:dienelactone hydrolase
MKQLIVFIFTIFSFNVSAAVVSKEVQYTDGETNMKGYLVYDDSFKGQRPGVLVVHEWWGHNDYARQRARMLAKLGYRAMAIDMYGDGKTANHPKDAGKFAGAVRSNLPLAKKRFMAAYDYLQKQDNVEKSKMGAVGYCFGGGIILEMVRNNVDLDVAAVFHGSLGSENKASPGTRTKIIVLNGAADPFIKPESITGFKQEMKEAGIEYEFNNYPGAKHAFTNPGATKLGKQFNIPL